MAIEDDAAGALARFDDAVREYAAGRIPEALRAFELSLRHFSGYPRALQAMQGLLRTLPVPPAVDPSLAPASDPTAAALYLDLLERCLTGMVYRDAGVDGIYDPDRRLHGRDWPGRAHTMIGLAPLRHLRQLAERVIHDAIPGDFIETGVWRGGACIMLAGVLKALGDRTRRIWVADSFQGLPKPDPETYAADRGDTHHTVTELAVSEAEVRSNFSDYGLLDEQVTFLPGWFKDTLDDPRIRQLAIMRLDGDMYQSTMEALTKLYPKLSPGGFVIIDDAGTVQAALRAVIDFRKQWRIDSPLVPVSHTLSWRKE